MCYYDKLSIFSNQLFVIGHLCIKRSTGMKMITFDLAPTISKVQSLYLVSLLASRGNFFSF